MTNVGTLVLLKIGSVLVVGESSTSFKSAQKIIETSNKTSGNDAAFVAGRITRTISVSSLASTDPSSSTYGYKAALDAQAAGSTVAFTLTEYTTSAGTTAATGAIKITGNCLISNVSVEFPDNDKMTFSLDLQVTGSVTVTTN